MKAVVLATCLSLCILSSHAGAVEFPNASVTDGICVDVGRGISFDQAMKLREAGVAAVRTAFYGYILKDVNGNMTYDEYDRFVKICAKAGLRVYASLQGPSLTDYGSMKDGTYFQGPKWESAATANYLGSAGFRNHFNALVVDTVAHYTALANTLKANVDNQYQTDPNWNPNFTWELWNEPNLGFWPGKSADGFMKLAMGVSGDAHPEGALQLIRDAASAVGGIGSKVTIIAPAVSMPSEPGYPLGIDFLTICFQQGLLKKVDGISIHPYQFTGNCFPENAVNDYNAVRSKIPQGFEKMPIIDGEWGYSAGPTNGLTPETQAKWLQRMMLVNFSQTFSDGSPSVPMSSWFMDVDMLAEQKWCFGLFESSGPYLSPYGKPKPAYFALQTLTRSLHGKKFHAKLHNSHSDVWLLEFTGSGGQDTLAAWSTKADGRTVTVAGWGAIKLTDTPQYITRSRSAGP